MRASPRPSWTAAAWCSFPPCCGWEGRYRIHQASTEGFRRSLYPRATGILIEGRYINWGSRERTRETMQTQPQCLEGAERWFPPAKERGNAVCSQKPSLWGVCRVKDRRSTVLLCMYYDRVYINSQPTVHNAIWLLRGTVKHASKFLSFPACNIQEEAICRSAASIFHVSTEQSQMAWHSTTSRHVVQYSTYVIKWAK